MSRLLLVLVLATSACANAQLPPRQLGPRQPEPGQQRRQSAPNPEGLRFIFGVLDLLDLLM